MSRSVEALVGGVDRAYGDDGFRDLLEMLPAAVYTTDTDGIVTFCNRLAMEMAGRAAVIGEDRWCITFRLYHPDGSPLPHDECPMAIALKERRPVRDVDILVERPDGLKVPVLPYPTPIFDRQGNMMGAVNVLVDISKLKAMERTAARHAEEQAALYRFTDRLYRAPGREDVVEAALDAITSALSVRRGSILLFDQQGVARFVGWRGLSPEYRAAVEGHCPWKPGERAAEPIFVSDIDLANEPESLKRVVRAEGIRGLAFIPITVDGGVIGKFMTYHETAHIFSDDERSLAITIARQLGFALERLRSEEERNRVAQQRDLLVAELSHRVKNTLATVTSIARQSFARGDSADVALKSFEGRLRTLAQTHGRLADSNWDGASLQRMIADELAPYRSQEGDNIDLSGSDISLNPRSAVVIGMALHELTTNAAKYGALSSKDGRLAVRWSLLDEPRRLRLEWNESGGPVVTPPTRSGFGRLLLEQALKSDLRGEVNLQFLPHGLQCLIVGNLEN
jgi:PAS domain S-box-containing protein